MFLTTAETTLIGVALGGGFSWGSARIMLVATRSSDHRQRIWTRTVDLYEQLLFQARTWASIREKAMQTLLTESDREILSLDVAERQSLLIRLEMFGHPQVQAAFERYADAHWQWIASEQARQFAFEQNTEAVAWQGLEQPVSGDEIARLRENRQAANDLADQQHTALRGAVRGVVHRVPKSRWFRRNLG
ncbi:hypothetical protein [Amycolatopsis sp. Poz14]|uniref:hypothetical protein n=1 Tax=Amycolatopsis sp. Poz14 TaxID=1447705 RepID=UPI001EE799DE|nr:hypothetical protein [Amycolatopsis sp. Poz14]MCG3755836.1 hypothetical protein [Amycolatopsis sp. Poz14]